MAVASFLVKDLHLAWQRGAQLGIDVGIQPGGGETEGGQQPLRRGVGEEVDRPLGLLRVRAVRSDGQALAAEGNE